MSSSTRFTNSSSKSYNHPVSMLPPLAKSRIIRELSYLSTSPLPGIKCYTPNDTLTHLHAQITGPPNTPFENGSFLLVIQIPFQYPYELPRMRFLTPMHHPNVDPHGHIIGLDAFITRNYNKDNRIAKGSTTSTHHHHHHYNHYYNTNNYDFSLPDILIQIRSLFIKPHIEEYNDCYHELSTMTKPSLDMSIESSSKMKTMEQYLFHYDSWMKEAKEKTKYEATFDKLLNVEKEYLKRLRFCHYENDNDLSFHRSLSYRSSTSLSSLLIHDHQCHDIDTEMNTLSLCGTKRKPKSLVDVTNNNNSNNRNKKYHYER